MCENNCADYMICRFSGQFPSIANLVPVTISLLDKFSDLENMLSILSAYFEAIVNYYTFCEEHRPDNRKLSNKLSKEKYRLVRTLIFASDNLEKFAEADFGTFDII